MKKQETLTQFKHWLESRYCSDRTVGTYYNGVAHYLDYLKVHPEIASSTHSKRVEKYLSWRVQIHDISPSTQSVELNAIIQFYRMLNISIVRLLLRDQNSLLTALL